MDSWLQWLDTAVGLAFVAAALVSRVTIRERLLVGAVAAAWFAGSVWPLARTSHQALLAVALLAWPSGRLTNRWSWTLAIVALATVVWPLSAIGAAAEFAAVAVVVGLRRRAAGFPPLAAAAVAMGLGLTWWSVRSPQPPLAPLFYEASLLVVAAGFSMAGAWHDDAPAWLDDQALATVPDRGLPALEAALRRYFRDPGLTLVRGQADVGTRGDRECVITVAAEADALVSLRSTSPDLDDPSVARATGDLVTAVAANLRMRDVERRQVSDMLAARSRLMAASESERRRTAHELRDSVASRLQHVETRLDGLTSDREAEVADLVRVAADETRAVADYVQAIVDGIPTRALGQGRLREGLAELCERSPLPIRLTTSKPPGADEAVETALFYACSEALANATKHANANRVDVNLSLDGDRLRLTVVDDGVGGADPRGSGLAALAHRLALIGGRLAVEERPASGTILRAWGPATSPSGEAPDRLPAP